MRRASFNRSYGSVWLLLGLFLVVGAFEAMPGTRDAVYDGLKLTREGVLHGEVWRLASYPFLTGRGMFGPLATLFFVVMIFYYIAAPLEAVWGTRRFLTLFGVSVLGGGAAGVLFHQPLAGGGAPVMTLMLIHGFMFPDSMIYVMLFLPMRVKTVAILLTAAYLVSCVLMGVAGLAYFLGLFCGALYYVLVMGTVPWVRRAKRKVFAAAADPAGALRGVSAPSLLDRVREIMRRRDGGRPLTDRDRDLIQELVQRSDPAHELCSPYSFSPDNTICPPCKELGRCLRRYVEEVRSENDER